MILEDACHVPRKGNGSRAAASNNGNWQQLCCGRPHGRRCGGGIPDVSGGPAVGRSGKDQHHPGLQSVSWRHPLGTDLYGRDLLSRIIYAARLDLTIALAATAIAVVIGALAGAPIGYFGGWIDQVTMRAVDALMAFPAFVLAMGITAALGNSALNVAIAISITQIPGYLRLIRGEMLRAREMEYAEAARAVGNPTWRIVLVHLLPNCIPPLVVQATLAMGYALLTMAALSFIGLGIQPPQSEWGVMTAEGASQIVTGEWWLFVFPGLAIVIAVLAFNLIGDGLRDALDPRMRGVR